MIGKLPFIFLFALLLPFRSHAQSKSLYIFGGTGDPPGPTTLVDGEISNVSSLSRQGDWQTRLSFDGGHPATQEMLASQFASSSDIGPFTLGNYNAAIKEIETKIESGKIPKDGQLMMVIDSHGVPNMGGGEISHSIGAAKSAKQLGTTTVFLPVSMDTLKPLIASAKTHGVHLAIIDASCYSGATQALANDNTCIISSTGPNIPGFAVRDHAEARRLGYHAFSDDLFSSMKPGSNLEDLYLDARRKSFKNPDFPMISTPAGRHVQDEIQKLVIPYLKFDGDKVGQEFTGQYGSDNISGDRCATNQNFIALKSLLENIRHAQATKNSAAEISDLESSLKRYRDFQLNYEKSLSNAQSAGNEVLSLISSKFPDKKDLFKDQDGLSAALADYDGSMNSYKQGLATATDDDSKKFFKEQIESVGQQKAVMADVMQRLSPASKAALNQYQRTLKVAGDKSYEYASDVSAKLRKVYDQLYQSESSASNRANACRDFVL